MSFRTFLLESKALLAAVLVSASLGTFSLLTGCGAGPADTAGVTLPAISGMVHGGQSPTQNSTVTLYVTSTAAGTTYASAGTVIGTATTDVNGGFVILPSATPVSCPSGSQAYITAAGGYQSGQPTLVNNSMLLMAALGDCKNISAATSVIINEVTTVAAAYALSGFMSTSAAATGSLYVANVGAPAANRAATGSTTAAAGLAHAFLNAANLANYASGAPNAATAPLTSAGVSLTGTVPAVELNTLGDILQNCVDGATGNSICTSLFGFTPSISGLAPVNTLQSMINLARNPYPSAAAMNATTGLFSLVSGTAAFQPALTAVPADWTLAIIYRPLSAALLYNLAMDANDTVWGGLVSSPNIVGLSPYGTATKAYTAAATGSATRQVAPDALGNIWVGNNSTLLLQYSATAGGAATNTYTYTGALITGVAVDALNNVWIGNAANNVASGNIFELVPGGTASAAYTVNYTAETPSGGEPVTIKLDANQNVWSADYYLTTGGSGGTFASVLPNLSAATPTATPTYAPAGSTTATPVSATFVGAMDPYTPFDMVFDTSGNAWYELYGGSVPTNVGIEEVIPTFTSSVLTSLTPQNEIETATLGTKAVGRSAIDGAGSIFIPDNGGLDGIHVFSTNAATSSSNTSSQVISPPAGYLGCAVVSGGTTCGATGTSASAIYNPRVVAIDSTGSTWSTNTTGAGGMTQTIGLAAPTWPLLSEGKPSLSPGNTAVAPLP